MGNVKGGDCIMKRLIGMLALAALLVTSTSGPAIAKGKKAHKMGAATERVEKKKAVKAETPAPKEEKK